MEKNRTSNRWRDPAGRVALPLGFLAVALAGASAGAGLLAGLAAGLLLGNPYLDRTRRLPHVLLAASVVGLGAGMDLAVVGRVGLHGIGFTLLGLGLAGAVGAALRRVYGIGGDLSTLITVGTAICGGSAIAAVAPVLRAKHHEVTVALGTVFLLNGVALFLFPWIGLHLALSQSAFGLWCALAIHDTSSVVGATLGYGAEACRVGTTVKLARALWIVPVTLAVGRHVDAERGAEPGDRPASRPWFILGFLAMAALVTWVPVLRPTGQTVVFLAQRLLVATLFLVGANLTRESLASVGWRPLAFGLSLWAVTATATLGGVLRGWIHL